MDTQGSYRSAESDCSSDVSEPAREGRCPSGCEKESVYRFIVLYPELHRTQRGGYWSCDVFISLLMLVLTAVCQVSIVRIAGGFIVNENIDRYHSTVQEKYSYTVDLWPGPIRELAGRLTEPDEQDVECCHDFACSATRPCCLPALEGGGNQTRLPEMRPERLNSICIHDKHMLDCGPPSFQLFGRWSELDINQDLFWSHDEAKADVANLGCRIQLTQLELFRTVCLGIIASFKVNKEMGLATLSVPYEVEAMQAVPHDYFALWEGLIILCSTMDSARCGALVAEGVFNGALGLQEGNWKLAHALEYCARMLVPGGVCDTTMPVTYALHHQKFAGKCGQAVYSAGPWYTNPYDQRDSVRSVALRYSEVVTMERAHSFEFKFFVWIMLLLWLVTLNKELASVLTMTDFALNFPAADENPLMLTRESLSRSPRILTESLTTAFKKLSVGKRSCLLDKGSRVTISDITDAHRMTCWFVLILRSIILVYMLAVGIIYATCTNSYLDLLMNTVALAFVFELPELFYQWLLPESVKDEMERTEFAQFEVPPRLCLPKVLDTLLQSRFFHGLATIPFMAFVIVELNDDWHVKPLLEVLRCACGQIGDSCKVGSYLQSSWWDSYWGRWRALAIK